MLLHWGASSSLSPQCRRSVSQGLGSFQSPGAHPSKPPAKLLLSLLHPLSLTLLFLCSPLGALFPLSQLIAFNFLLHLSLFFFSQLLCFPQQHTLFAAKTLLVICSSLPFPFSSSPGETAPSQPHIIRPEHKPAQAHIWKEFGHGSFLPRRLNI